MKTRNTKNTMSRGRVNTAALLSAGLLSLTPLAASAQMRGGMSGGFGGGMSRGGGFGGGTSGGSGGASYSAPQAARPSYTPAPSVYRPGYSPSYSPFSSPSSSRPGYSPSYSPQGGANNLPMVRGGGSDPLFGRSTPSGYNYGESGRSNYGYPAQNREQFSNQGAGQYPSQAQTGRQYAPQTGRTVQPSVPGPGNYPNVRQSPITQVPLSQSRQFTQPSSRTVNSLVYSHNPAYYGNLHGLNAGNAYSSAYNPANPYRYRYGIPHGNQYYYGNYGFNYFSGGLAFYPYYSPYFSFGYTALSPYAFYYGGFPSFITLGSVYTAPPEYVYVPYPVYQNGVYSGERSDDVDSYYLNRSNRDDSYRVGENRRSLPAPTPARDPALESALADIRDSWKTGKIDALAKHVRRDAKVAVYLRGKYQYSLDAGDYLDMTRDALSATQTVRFDLDAPQRKENGVYAITGRHIYRDKNGNQRTVHVTYVLEKSDNDYVLTQVGSAPDKLDDDAANSQNSQNDAPNGGDNNPGSPENNPGNPNNSNDN